MVEKSSSGFFGCINPCKFGWQNFSVNQVKPTGFGLFEGAFPNDMGECEECKIRFSFLKRKKFCSDCGLGYCTSCLSRLSGGRRQCRKCNVLSHWPINRDEISSLRVRDLRHFLSACKIPTNTYKEKQELIDLVIIQLRLKHLGHSHGHYQNFVRAESSSNNTATTRDDGIRIQPQSTHLGTNQLPSETASAIHNHGNDDGSGIRVFPSSQDVTQDNTEQPSTNMDHSDTSSSSWSLLHSEGMQDGSSSDSLSQSSNLENPSNNLPPDDDSEIIQEVHASDNNQNEEREETLQQSNAQPSCKNSKQTCVADVIKLSSLENEDSIKELSVRQCKEILILHRVDFSGVWEKHELVNKVKMLWKDYKQRQEEEKDMTEDQLCKICMDAMIDCVLLECGHMLSCTDCGKQMAECPICRQNVIRVLKTFRA